MNTLVSNKPIQNALNEIRKAYADCNGGNHDDRDLDFIASTPITLIDLGHLIELIGDYNGFNPELIFKNIDLLQKTFGKDSLVFVAREGSPCLYIRPTNENVWFGDRNTIQEVLYVDEFSYNSKIQMFRLWWD